MTLNMNDKSRFVINKQIIRLLNDLVDEYRELRFNQLLMNFVLGIEHDQSLTTWGDIFHEDSDATLTKIKNNITRYNRLEEYKDNKQSKQLNLFDNEI